MREHYWTGKRLLITGGSSGLGRALAAAALARGARVAVVARHIGADLPAGAIGIEADLANKKDIYRISAEALGALGGLDILINNASALGPTPLRLLIDTECEEFSAVLETNLMAPFRLTRALLPTFLLQSHGVVVNISSDTAINAYPGWGSYSVSKAALDHLSRIWHEELKLHGIHFFAIDPGDMDTPMHAAAIPDADPATLKSPRAAAQQLLTLLESSQSNNESVRRSL